MNTYGSASRFVMFSPGKENKTIPKMARLLCNDNEGETELQSPA